MNTNERHKISDSITVCIPIRIDSKERLSNLECIVDHFSNNGVRKILILESDKESYINPEAFNHGFEHIFEHDDNPRFHRTRLINMMLDRCVTPYAAIWDADVIVPFESFKKAMKVLDKGEATIVYPFDGRLWDIKEYFSEIFRIFKDEGLFSQYQCQIDLLNGYDSVGGGFLVNIQKYRAAGMENENFIGWGPEDEERYNRMFILGHKVERINGEMYHLHHWRGINSSNRDKEMAVITKKEFAKVSSMNKVQLEKYVGSWSWLKK